MLDTHKNDMHNLLKLAYSLETSAIANSSIWSATSNQIEVCQVVQLVVPVNGAFPKMAIEEDIRELDIVVDFSADFVITNNLGEATYFSLKLVQPISIVTFNLVNVVECKVSFAIQMPLYQTLNFLFASRVRLPMWRLINLRSR